MSQFTDIDDKEIKLPDTIYVRDIESRVFQAIAIKCLSKIEGITLLEGTYLIDNLLGREGVDRFKGVYVEQDSKNHSVNIKVELNIIYGTSIPDKAEEIQTKIVERITALTGLHVASVHIIFKNMIEYAEKQALLTKSEETKEEENAYAEEF